MQKLLIFMFIVASLGIQSQEIARGVVFEDLNGNGQRDRSEKGIALVAVSNGRDVVLTDNDGFYSIGIEEGQVLFVIKPPEYAYPIDQNNLPKFFYIHKPQGSPKLQHAGSAPTGKLPSRINFGLRPIVRTDTFSMAVFADPQPYNEQQLDWYGKVIDQMAHELNGCDFGISLGDLTGDRPDFFEPLNAHTAKTGLPWFHVIGNHDLNFDALTQEHADETFERVYGPSTYAFNHGRVHFIVLNNILYPNRFTSRKYVGGLTDEQLLFVANNLRHVPSDRLIVLMMHIPLYNLYGNDDQEESFLTEVRRKLFEILRDYPHTFSLAGHMHLQRHDYFDETSGWLGPYPHHHYTVGTFGGDWWSGATDDSGIPDATMYDGTPRGYNIITFSGNTYTWNYFPTNAAKGSSMRIYHPKVYVQGKNHRADIFVNFFQGSAADSVFFSWDGQHWQKMRYTLEPDPYAYANIYPWDIMEILPQGSRPSQPLECRHLWRARPGRLPESGIHTLQVKAYQGNNIYTATSQVRVER